MLNVYSRFDRADGHTVWMHDDRWEGQDWRRSPGNIYSDVQRVRIDPRRDLGVGIDGGTDLRPGAGARESRVLSNIQILAYTLLNCETITLEKSKKYNAKMNFVSIH